MLLTCLLPFLATKRSRDLGKKVNKTEVSKTLLSHLKFFTVNKVTCLSFFKGSSTPSRDPKAANISPGFPSDSVKNRPEGNTDDFTGTGSYGNGKPSYNPRSRGTQKRITNKDFFASPDLDKLLKSIYLGKHLSKKVVRLLKSRPDLIASLSKALQDKGHRSSQAKHAELHGSPMPAHGTNVKLTNLSPEMDDQVIKALPDLKGVGIMSHKPSEADDQALLPRGKINHNEVVKQAIQGQESYSGKKQDSHKLATDVFKLGYDERRYKVLKPVTQWSLSV